MPRWSAQKSSELYNIPNWGLGYFAVNELGNVEVRPDPSRPERAIDLPKLIEEINRRGVSAPLLLRFDGLLRTRVHALADAFNQARAECNYSAPYRGVYPIKVNQERQVVETLLESGRDLGLGLEVGSKPELIAGMTLQEPGKGLLICNGYKDEEYIRSALFASRLGIETIIVVEKFSELDTILTVAEETGITPRIGVRTKLSFRGSGRWQDSVGDRSKFGLTMREIVRVAETLKSLGKLDDLQLLHFHLGSQITNIRTLKNAMREGTQLFLGLTKLGVKLRYFDIGGGLGVDYDGSSSNFESSMNYTVEEYARDVIWQLKEACSEHGVEEPIVISESGRALVAHHAVLISEVLGVSEFTEVDPHAAATEMEHEVVRRLAEIAAEVSPKNYQESYHDALEVREQAMLLFNVGQLALPERARADEFFWLACEAILKVIRTEEYVPEELQTLERRLASTYFLNFSLFQSLPDSWAIRQLFPVLPLHRLQKRPTRRGILADITCDSDGKVDRFIDLRDVKSTLELHPLVENEPYYLGFFLVGAYQEILGDMHNLFGDTNVVHVDLDASGRPQLTHVIRGDRVKEVLSYVDFFEADLLRDMRNLLEKNLAAGDITYEESAQLQGHFENALRGYTYLERHHSGVPSPT